MAERSRRFLTAGAPLRSAIAGGRLAALGAYLAVSAVGNLTWELLQLPLYTIWRAAPPGEIAWAVIHCTGGDVLIALAALGIGALAARSRGVRRAAVVIAVGLGCTVASEWWNVEVARSWAYSELMPRLPWLGTGLAPVAQWLVVPPLALWRSDRAAARARAGAYSSA
jgi:hypothetical protein